MEFSPFPFHSMAFQYHPQQLIKKVKGKAIKLTVEKGSVQAQVFKKGKFILGQNLS